MSRPNEGVERVVTAYRCAEDGRQFSSEADAWEHEHQLAENDVKELCRDYVKAGPADALTVATLLLEHPHAFAEALARVAHAYAVLGLVRRSPAAPQVFTTYDPTRQPMRTMGDGSRDPADVVSNTYGKKR